MPTRPLYPAEVDLARRWFGDTLDVRRVRLVPRLGWGSRPFVLTLLRTSYVFVGKDRFSRDLAGGPTVSLPDRRLLLHELTHAWQAQNGAGPRSYMWISLAHQARYGRGAYDVPSLDAPFAAFGPEQQARIVERASDGDPEAEGLLRGSGPLTYPPPSGGARRWLLAATPLGEVHDAFRAPFSFRGRALAGRGRRARMRGEG